MDEQSPLLVPSGAAATSNNNDVETGSRVSTHFDTNDDDSYEAPPLKDIQSHTIREQVVATLGAATFGTNIAAMFVELGHPAVIVSGTVGALAGPVAALQQRKITEVAALRETNERLSEEVDELHHENERLQANVVEIQESVQHLNELENTLETLQKAEGVSIDELEKQLDDSKDILGTMQSNLKGDILQNLISVLLSSDKDGDCIFGDEEIDDLIAKLEGLAGVNLKNDVLKKLIIDEGRSLNAILAVARDVLEGDDAEQKIFSVVESN